MFRPTWLLPAALFGALAVACGGEARSSVAQRGNPDGADAGPEPPSKLGFPWVLDGDVTNARDVGTVLVDTSHMVGRDSVYRGPTLAGLDAEGCAAFEALRVRTVVDLRVESERASTPETACVTEQSDLVFAPLPVPYDVSPSDYVAIVQSAGSMATAFRVLASYESYPVYVHCTYGRDRTGVFVGLLLTALGAPRDAIFREYSLSEQFVGAFPASLQAAFDEVDRVGGIENYLTSIGITANELYTLRQRLVISYD